MSPLEKCDGKAFQTLRIGLGLTLKKASEQTGFNFVRLSEIECSKGEPLSRREIYQLKSAYRKLIDSPA